MAPLWTQWLSLSFLQFYSHFRTLDLQETLETLYFNCFHMVKTHAWGHVVGASPQTVQVSLLLPQYFPWKADKYFYCVQVPSQSAVDPCLFFWVTSLLWKHDRHVPGPSSLFSYLLFTGLSTHMVHNGLRGPTPVYSCCLVNVALRQFYSEKVGTFSSLWSMFWDRV